MDPDQSLEESGWTLSDRLGVGRMKATGQPTICSSTERIAHVHCGVLSPPPHMLYRPWPSKQLHLAAEKQRLREVTLPKVKLLVRGPEIQTPQCLTTETRRSACAPGRPFVGLEKLPAVPLHTARWHRASGGKAEACPQAGGWCLLCKAA